MLTSIILIIGFVLIFGGSFFITSKLLQKKNKSPINEPIPEKESIEEDFVNCLNFCPYCGGKLSENAKFCSECGKFVLNDQPKEKLRLTKENKRQANIVFIILILAAFVIFLSVVLSKDSGTSTKPSKVAPEVTVATEPSLPTVGDTLEIKGVKVKFNNVKESRGSQFVAPGSGNVFVLCEFTIENNSSTDIGVSSMLSFECYVDDYATSISLNALIDDAVSKQLDGTIAPGKKIRGYIGYEVPRNWSDIEIHFIPYLGSTRDLVFYYSK